MFQSSKNRFFFIQFSLLWAAFVALLFSPIEIFCQHLPQITTDKKIKSQNYLPDYSYAGYHFWEMQLPQRMGQIINTTDYGVIANDSF